MRCPQTIPVCFTEPAFGVSGANFGPLRARSETTAGEQPSNFARLTVRAPWLPKSSMHPAYRHCTVPASVTQPRPALSCPVHRRESLNLRLLYNHSCGRFSMRNRMLLWLQRYAQMLE